jgi:hypothetical protein
LHAGVLAATFRDDALNFTPGDKNALPNAHGTQSFRLNQPARRKGGD